MFRDAPCRRYSSEQREGWPSWNRVTGDAAGTAERALKFYSREKKFDCTGRTADCHPSLLDG